MGKHKLIVLEGCDGSGKSSVAMGIAKEINGIYFKTPSKIFWDMREKVEETKDWNIIFYFYLTGTLMAGHEINQLLEHSHVVCDRYYYTTLAYHKCLGVKIPAGIEKLFTPPDFSFCLYANKEEVKRRLSTRTYVGPHDFNFDLQDQVLKEFEHFQLEFFDTSNLNVDESIQAILQKISL